MKSRVLAIKKIDLDRPYSPEQLFAFNSDEVKEFIDYNSKRMASRYNFAIAVLSMYLSRHDELEWNLYWGRAWILTKIGNIDNLVELLKHNKCGRNNVPQRLFVFIGQDSLRQAFEVTGLRSVCESFNFFRCIDEFQQLLSFLNGNDQWIKNKIHTGRDLSVILHSLIIKHDSFNFSEDKAEETPLQTFYRFIEYQWDSFIRLLDNDWKEKFLGDVSQFKGFVDEWIEHDALYDGTLEHFLSRYFDKKELSFKQIVDVLNFSLNHFPLEESKSNNVMKQIAVFNKAFSIVHIFQPKEWYNILLRNKKFDQVLANINQYHDRYFYKPLLYALTSAVYYERKNIPEGFALFGRLVKDKQAISDDDEILEAANVLMGRLKDNLMLDDKTKKIQGKIGKIRESLLDKPLAASHFKQRQR